MIKLDFKQSLDDFNLEIKANIPSRGITAIFGRSGAGKTSLINAISGIFSPDLGKIEIKNRTIFDAGKKINVPIEKRKIAYVFQDARLFPHYNVLGNLRYGSNLKQKDQTFKEIIDLLDIQHLLKRKPADLSGGEKQRCAIARALLTEPDMLLMDEPLAALDIPRKKEVMPYLEKLAKEVNCPILYVTHSLDEILHLADHLLLLDNGKVQALDSVERLWHSELLAPWLLQKEKSSLLAGKIIAKHPSYALTQVEIAPKLFLWMQEVDLELGALVRMRIYASHISITLSKAQDTSIRNILPARVYEISKPTGEKQAQITLSLDAQKVEMDCDLAEEAEEKMQKQQPILLYAQITTWALDSLELKQGMFVYAQIKSVGLTQQDTAQYREHPFI